MLDVLILRFDAPLMSFGGVQVDQRGVIREFPAQSMITGLLANALGYEHRDWPRLERLQERIRYAARRDRAGRRIMDFQTVDLGQDFLLRGWTTRGAPESRGGGPAREGTHIRQRHYLADALYTVAVALEPAAEEPTVGTVESALNEPERPLFLGRKGCLPAAPLVIARVSSATVLEALAVAPRATDRGDGGDAVLAWWPSDDADTELGSRLVPVTDERDWANQIHVGRRFVREGRLRLEGEHGA